MKVRAVVSVGLVGLVGLVSSVTACASASDVETDGDRTTESDLRGEAARRELVGVWERAGEGTFETLTFGTITERKGHRYTARTKLGTELGAYSIEDGRLTLQPTGGDAVSMTASWNGTRLTLTGSGAKEELKRLDEPRDVASKKTAWIASVPCDAEWVPTRESRKTTCNIHCTVFGSSIACSSSTPFVEPPVGSEELRVRDGFFMAQGTVGESGDFDLSFPRKISPSYPPDQEAHVRGRVDGSTLHVDGLEFVHRRNADEAHTRFTSALESELR